jgi:transcriptional regulator with XRE-family HTH domain
MMNHSKSTLAQNLITKRKENKSTQTETAEWLQIKQKRYAAWEEGRAQVPHEYLLKIAEMWGTSVDELLKATEDDNSSTDQEVQ